MPEDATEVTLILKDGRSYTEVVTHATGSLQNPMTDSQLDAKFRTLASDGLSKRRANTLLENLWNLDQAPDIRQALAMTRMRGRTVRL